MPNPNEAKEVYEWVWSILNSCNNSFHFEAADRIIDLFKTKYQNKELSLNLDIFRTAKWNQIHGILT